VTTAADLPGAYVRDLIELAARWNVPADALVRGLPVDLDALRDPTTRVPLAVAGEVMLRALRLTGEPALPLYVGWQMRLSSHGFLGFAAMTAGTVREAIELAVRFTSIRTTALGLGFYVEKDTASLVIEERAPLGALREFTVLSLLVGLWQLGCALTGRTLEGTAECAFPAPDYIGKVPFAGALVKFDRPANRLVFAAKLLDTPLTTADPVATQLARAQCERELAAIVDAGFPGRVRAAIARRSDGVPSLAEVARELHVSTRTLKRKLADRGTTFSAILDDVRRQRALLLLDDRALSIGEIAGKLGYSEVPNFTRAFRKWTGTTPGAYRAR
jgi:AraC-like DNA-binding protein